MKEPAKTIPSDKRLEIASPRAFNGLPVTETARVTPHALARTSTLKRTLSRAAGSVRPPMADM